MDRRISQWRWSCGAAFCVLLWREVTQLLLFCVFFVVHTIPFLCGLVVVGQPHRITIDARRERPFQGSDRPTGSIFLCCAWAFGSLILRPAHLFCFLVGSL